MKKRTVITLVALFIVAVTAAVLFSLNAGAAYEDYGLEIGGTAVTSRNLSGKGWKFDPNTNTLTLNGFEITSGGTYHQKINDGTTWLYSFIHVDDDRKMDLTIRTEGKESTIGYDALAGKNAVPAGDGTYLSYFGIYNKNGNVTITGSARLNIKTNQLCIYTGKKITVDECSGGLSMYAHVNGIRSKDLIVKGGSKVNVSCGYSGNDDYEAAITASRSISLYDTSEIHAEVERRESSTKGYIAAITCWDGTINVYGGKLSAVCYMGGKQSDGFFECFAIRVKTLNISGGGVVEAQVRTASGQKDYRRSATIGQYNGSTGTINFKGAGILRAGVEMKNPNGGQRVYPQDEFNHLNNTIGLTSDFKMDGTEITYIEYTAYEREGIFLHEGGSMHHWSYYRRPLLGSNNYFFSFDLSDAIIAGTDYNIYSVSGSQIMNPYVENGEIPMITVESGELTLWLYSGRSYHFTNPIEVRSGATLKIYGLGTADGLDIRGGGTVIFQSGTVTGQVQKTLKMVVEGGNVNVDYDGQATDANGVKVWKQPYVLANTDSVFDRITQISVRGGRNYSAIGVYPIDGRKVYLWMQSPEELESLSAVPSGYSSSLTLRGQPGEPLWLTLFQTIGTNERTLYVATRGMSVLLRPFAHAPTAEQMREYTLIWSFSDDGLNWTTIENPDCDDECQLTYKVPTGESWINRTFRCELRKTATNEQLGVYTATLHIFNPKIVNETPFSENQMIRLRLVEGTLPPDGQGVTIERIRWYISDDGGKNYVLHTDANGKEVYSFKVTTALEGRVIRCEAQLSDGTTLTDVALSETITVEVTDRWVEIIKQPESITISIPTGNTHTIKVIDRYATSYQWQVSKRTYSGENVPFEDIPGANKYYYALRSLDSSQQYYAYRCVVSNDFSEVITDEVTVTLLYDPFFYDVKGFSTTIREGEDALFETMIMGGNPLVATEIYWEVYRGSGGYVRLSEIEELRDYITVESLTKTSGGITYHTQTILRISGVTLSMNGWQFRCTMVYGDGKINNWPVFSLKVLTECQQDGHDWADPTCTAPSTCTRCGETQGEALGHKGGVATCISCAVCEVCGEEYGDFDRENHPADATDVWNVEDWQDDAGHHSKWSCCGRPKYPYEYHKWEEGICTVCGCICEHPLYSPGNCHERAWCHICHIEFGQIDPDNHDLETLGTTVRDQKDPTCTEDGYTGDIICWECLNVVTPGTVLPAKGHSTSWKATCKEPAYCSDCQSRYGDPDPDNHAEPWSAYYIKTAEHHEQHWNCCDKVTTAPHDFRDGGVCRVCLYGCDHSGGTATCMEPALCDHCGDPYGATDPHNHEYADFMWTEETHTGVCMCGAVTSPTTAHTWENGICTVCRYECFHTGGRATCTEEALCSLCGERYGGTADHTYSPAWSQDGENHWHECTGCGEKADEAAHTPGEAATENTPQVCTVCNHELAPATGHTHDFTLQITEDKYLVSAATCTAKAVYRYSCACGAGGEETFTSGETTAHRYDDSVWTKGGTAHWHLCLDCGEEIGTAAHEDTDGNHLCDTCEKTLGICEDADHNHFCDVCGRMLSKHSGGTATCKAPATCTVCGKAYGDVGEHIYADTWSHDGEHHWHACTVCGEAYEDAGNHLYEAAWSYDETHHWHACAVCDRRNGQEAHTDADNDHRCDTCGKAFTECADGNNDHKCDLCGKVLSECADGNNDHKCDVCGKVLSECTDNDNDHKCDLCGKTLSEEGGGPAGKSTGAWIAGIAGGTTTIGIGTALVLFILRKKRLI